MTTTEAFSWCACLSIGALATLAAGVPGLLCLICGMIVSQIDVGWIEDRLQRQRPADQPQDLAAKWRRLDADLKPKEQKVRHKRAADALPDNVIPLKPKTKVSKSPAL